MKIIFMIVLLIGGFNWASIGLLQYDFIAGFFGTQASIFSRLIYIGFGVATLYVLFMFLKNKGKYNLFEKNKQKDNHNYNEYGVNNSDNGNDILS